MIIANGIADNHSGLTAGANFKCHMSRRMTKTGPRGHTGQDLFAVVEKLNIIFNGF